MRFLYSSILITLLAFNSFSQTNEELSVSFIKKLERQQFDSCFAMFDTVMANKFNAGMLESMWGTMPKYMGEYKGYSTIESTKRDSIDVVAVRCEFEKTKMDLQFAYNDAKKIIGMYFVPPKSKTAYVTPEYAQQNKYYETKIAVKTGTMSLPGALCVPNNTKNPPVVVLLAGSGPNDKDESIGPNKPLKDLAVGLASNGIATYRYDKRTLTYGKEISQQMDKFDLEQEVVEDALSAIDIIKKNPEFKNSKIYIAGHSLGGMVAPLIARKSKAISGIILLAGNATHLEDLLIDQYTYIYGLDSLDTDEKQKLETLAAQVKTVKDPKLLEVAKPADLPLGLTSFYWKSLNQYNQLHTAKTVSQPVLVLQGERDYQVTMTDFNIWRQHFRSNPKTQFISYPTLNHLFMKGEGKSTPSEYDKQGNVEEKVILDIAAWIKGQSSSK
jgi:dienelactone hydrolase